MQKTILLFLSIVLMNALQALTPKYEKVAPQPVVEEPVIVKPVVQEPVVEELSPDRGS